MLPTVHVASICFLCSPRGNHITFFFVICHGTCHLHLILALSFMYLESSMLCHLTLLFVFVAALLTVSCRALRVPLFFCIYHGVPVSPFYFALCHGTLLLHSFVYIYLGSLVLCYLASLLSNICTHPYVLIKLYAVRLRTYINLYLFVFVFHYCV